MVNDRALRTNMDRIACPRAVLKDTIKWDWDRKKFAKFATSIEGHLLQTGMGYMCKEPFQNNYLELGTGYFSTESFYKEYLISAPQAMADREALFGLLQSSTSTEEGTKHAVLKSHDRTKDGIMVWIEMTEM